MTSELSFKDYFSARSELYAQHRPTYPDELFDFLAEQCHRRDLAWDCATGNGQAAIALSKQFSQVIATDASEAQIAAAMPEEAVRYAVARAEDSGLDDGSVNLITVGQALHWFEREQFFREARRVSSPGAVLAAWCYELCTVSADCDAIIDGLYAGILAGFWPAERALIDARYRTITMPGTPIAVPKFGMSVAWGVDDMLGYLGTWSACKRYQVTHGEDPVQKIAMLLREAWGRNARTVRWPLTIRACRL